NGTWTLRNEYNSSDVGFVSSDGGSIAVTGRAADNATEAPVVLTAEVSPRKVDKIFVNTTIVVYARLLRGHSPVTAGKLFATVKSDAELVATVDLSDNGAGADLKIRDGTYSAYLPIDKLNEARDFSVSVTSLSPVSRVAPAGKVTVDKVNAGFNRQQVPPAKVIDLRVTVNAMDQTAMLIWTAMEDP
uniref:Ig-like_bact domain-containing protein n=1 Tax=Macrostomum lignano TaxID=282301 RepID=A0A1I8G3W3_9PLAT